MPTKTAPAEGTITTRQMRSLHGLLRDHGISGDKAVHDYLNADLTEHGEPPVESRSALTATQAARIIADLEAADVAHVATDARLQALRAPFPAEAIGRLPRSTCKACSQAPRKRCEQHTWVSRCGVCGNNHSSATMHIDYVGHADVTDRLLQIDPGWTWEPMARDQFGMPVTDRNGGLWINLTVLGVTRPGYGDVTGTGGAKEAIGDALRNAAMRFGVALDLWAKGDREWAHAEKDGAENTHMDQAPPRQQQPPRQWDGPTTAALLLQIDGDATRAGVTYEQAVTRLLSDVDVDGISGLDGLDPWVIAPYAAAVRKRADEVVAEREAAAAAAPAEDTPDPFAAAPDPAP